MSFVGPFVLGGASGGLTLQASTVAVIEGSTGVIAQLITSVPAPVTFSRVSGSDITVSVGGAVSFTTSLAAGATRVLVARAQNTSGVAIEMPITFVGIVVPILVGPLTIGAATLTSAMAPGATVAAIAGKSAGSTVAMIGPAFDTGTLAVNSAGTEIIVGVGGPLSTGSVTGEFSLVETLAAASNSPRTSGPFASLTVTLPPVVPADFEITSTALAGPGTFAAIAALGNAALSGKTVSVAPGVYPARTLVDIIPATPVEFFASNPADRPILEDFSYNNCQRLTLSGIHLRSVRWVPTSNAVVSILGGSATTTGDIVFDDCEFSHGYRGTTAPFNPLKTNVYPEYASIPAQIVGGVISVITGDPERPLKPFVGDLVPDGTGYALQTLPAAHPSGGGHSGFAGTFDVVGGFITNIVVTNGGTGYASGVQFSRILGWAGRNSFQDYLAYGVQTTVGGTNVGNLTFRDCLFRDLGNAIKASPTNGGTLSIIGCRFTRIYQDYISLGANVAPALPPVVRVNWNFADYPFSAIGDPDDPHSDFFQIAANDSAAPFSQGRMDVEMTGNIAFANSDGRGYFQSFLASDSPNSLLAPGGTNDFAFRINSRYNILLSRRLPQQSLISNVEDSVFWRNTIVRYKFDDPENAGTSAICSFGSSDVRVNNVNYGALSTGTTLFGRNIIEVLVTSAGTADDIDFTSFPGVRLGGNGSAIPYGNVFAAPTSEPLTVEQILAAFRTNPGFAGIGAWDADGAVDYVNRTFSLTAEPSFLRFRPRFGVALGTTIESARSRLSSGPATADYTTVTGGTLREYTTATGGVGTVMPASGTLTRGRWYTLDVASAGANSTTTSASITVRGSTYGFAVTTVSTPYVHVDNGGVAYSSVPSGWADTGLSKFVFATSFGLDTIPASNGRVFAGSTGSTLGFSVTATNRLRFILGGSTFCFVEAGGLTITTGTRYLAIVSVDFTQPEGGAAVRLVVNGVNYPVTIIGFDSIPVVPVGSEVPVGTRTLAASSFAALGFMALSTGSGIIDGNGGLIFGHWGTAAYELPSILDPAVINGFSRDRIGADGSGPLGIQPKFCWYDDSVANYNGALANRGSVPSKPLTRIAGTYA